MPPTIRACPNCRTQLPPNAAFCYACGVATPAAIDRDTGEFVSPEDAGVTMADILPRLRALLGRSYELGERIGAGGFSEVYLATDQRLKREVAIKVTRPDFALNAQMMHRFRREAETIAALRHPHIMPIYDIGEAAGLAYIVMPFVRGESLKTRLDRDGRVPTELARRILLQAADALGAAHDAGVVHRDVKPDNIMLDRREDHVLLMDFGIAKALEAAGETTALTSTGLVMGTPHYMSPEQATGERTVDARADEYALGVVGYRMVAGALPFDGPTVRAILAKQLLGEPAPLHEAAPDAPPALVAAIERAMQKEPDDRFVSVREFAAALRADPTYAAEVLRASGGLTTSTSYTPLTPTTTVPNVEPLPSPAVVDDERPSRRTRWLWFGAIAAGLATLLLLPKRDEPPAPATADSAAAVRAVAPDTAARVDSALRAAAERSVAVESTPAGVAAPIPDSTVRRLAADSARVKSAGLTYGTPAAEAFLANYAKSRRRSCEQRYADGKLAEAAAVCGAVAKLGNPAAQRTLGAIAERAGHFDSAAYWYERAQARDVEAAVRLARLLDGGLGTAADPARATTLLTTAAERGAPTAQRALGERLVLGTHGVKRDERGGAAWYERAASGGDLPSMLALAELFRTGKGVKKSDQDAALWWQRGAGRGDSAAQYRLGMAYLRGKGVAKSDSIGLVWLRMAAAQGHEGGRYEVQKREPRRQ